MSLHPVVWLCWLVLAVCVTIVVVALVLDWWERRQDARTYQIRTRHHGEVKR
jgi:uncharacterized SAM-binding protein YcdF (DUF218 family)